MKDSFDWSRPVPKEWQDDLDILSPGERVSRLVIHWLAGFKYDPVQRFAIWEVLPATAVADILEGERAAGISDSFLGGIWKDLKGPDPRKTGTWVKDPSIPQQFGGQRWVSRSGVSRYQWDIHQQTGGLPMLCWIIEGENGGHSWQFGQFEQDFLLAAGTDPTLVQQMADAWPDPGSLPYAPYDNRTFHALAERDQLAKYRQGRPWEERSKRTDAGLILATESASRRSEMLARMTKWIDNQISDAVSDIPRKLLPQWSEFTSVDRPADDEEMVHNYTLE